MAESETQAQIRVMEWWELHCAEYGLPAEALVHVANEQPSARRRILAAQMGVRAGFPDLMLLAPRAGKALLFIEFKRESIKGTRNPLAGLSPKQKAYREFLLQQGYGYAICRGENDLIEQFALGSRRHEKNRHKGGFFAQ